MVSSLAAGLFMAAGFFCTGISVKNCSSRSNGFDDTKWLQSGYHRISKGVTLQSTQGPTLTCPYSLLPLFPLDLSVLIAVQVVVCRSNLGTVPIPQHLITN